jgi:2-oxoglutarate ferredoxin oxidoreductase subunit gamma
LRIAGFGGQGVVTLGTILAVAAGVHENLEVAQSQSYGPEARGGACRSDVVISDEPIDYTKPLALDVFVALSPAAAEKYWPEVGGEEGRTVSWWIRLWFPHS